MVGIPPIKMVMNGGWFIIAIPTLQDIDTCLSLAILRLAKTLPKSTFEPGQVSNAVSGIWQGFEFQTVN